MERSSRAARIAALLALGASLAIAAPAGLAKGEADIVVVDGGKSMVVMGGSLKPTKPVPGNFVGAGGTVTLDQPVGKNVVAAGGTVDVKGPVGKSVRAAGGTVTIDAPVGGGVAAAGGEVTLGKQAMVGGSARIFAGEIVVNGVVNGNLEASGGSITINGEVRGNVKAAAEDLVLGPGAKIGGALTYVGASEVTKGQGATIGGKVTRETDEDVLGIGEEAETAVLTALNIAGTLLMFFVVLACGAAFIAVAPIFSVEASDRVKASPGKSFGLGLLTLVGVPFLAVLFMITVIGIPVGVLLLMMYPPAILLGFVVGTLWVSGYVPRLLRKPPPPTVAKAIGYFALALFVVMLLGKVPKLGALVLILVMLVGVGAFVVEAYRKMRSGGARGRVEVVRP